MLELAGRRRLPAPVQLPAATVSGSSLVLAGGLSAADTSLATVTVVGPASITSAPPLPAPIHDAAAATLSGRALVFGGGEPSHAEIREIGPGAGIGLAGQLPVPASDVAATSSGGAAYVVGATTAPTRWTRSSDSPATGRRRWPDACRAACATPRSARPTGALVIAGGTVGTTASSAVYGFDPSARSVRRIGSLPHPLTHAAAATLGRWVYVIGGRHTTQAAQTDAILAIDPRTGRVRPAGRLPHALSDAGAGAIGNRILVAGGRTATGAVSADVLSLAIRPASGG